MAQRFIPQATWDETLLHQGKYREWFWSSLNEAQTAYLKLPAREQRYQCSRCFEVFHRSLLRRAENGLWFCSTCRRGHSKGGDVRRWRNRTDHSDKSWKDDAACLGADPEIFFPPNVAYYNDPDALWRKYCTGCPVAHLCKLEAIDSNSQGIFGGEWLGGSHDNRINPFGTGRPGRPRKATT
jgi:ribosomal protein L37AE/L43A